jgi:transposase-like protein
MDYSSSAVRRLAQRANDAGQARRLLAIAAVLDGSSREEVARVGGIERQTLRDWVIRFNERGPGPHQGRWCFGKTPMQTFLDAMPMTKEKMMPPNQIGHQDPIAQSGRSNRLRCFMSSRSIDTFPLIICCARSTGLSSLVR